MGMWNTYFWVDSADEAASRVRAAGGVVTEPFDAPWSTPTYTIRITVIGDPQGVTFTASEFAPKA
jgi:uncharacterized protein